LRIAAVLVLALSCAACARRFRVEGIVLGIDRPKGTILVSHRPIPGYMPAMAMPFHVSHGRELDALTPGARVAFQLKVGRGKSTLFHLRRIAAAALDVPVPLPAHRIAIGEQIPDFALTDQYGRRLSLSSFRGRVVAIDFIYTRCPLPDVCPRLSANFASVQRRAPDAVLLSVTVDPQYDTPAVLTDYARRWGAIPERWHFLTGSLEQVEEVAGYFGLVFWADEGMITHSVATGVIDREGKLAAVIEGPSYRWEQLRDLIESVGRR
jgi:protein SCO1